MAVAEVCLCPYCSSERTCVVQVMLFVDPVLCRCIFAGVDYLVGCPYFVVMFQEEH